MMHDNRSSHAVIPGFRAPDRLLGTASGPARLPADAAPAHIDTWRTGLIVACAAAILVAPMAALAAVAVLVMAQLSLIVICNLPAASRTIISWRPGQTVRLTADRSGALCLDETRARLFGLFPDNNRKPV